MALKGEKIEVQNVNHPGLIERVDATKYHEARDALLQVLPKAEPGMNAKDLKSAMQPHLSQDLFPGGATSGWWMKTVQLDLEAKGVIKRLPTKPLTWIKL